MDFAKNLKRNLKRRMKVKKTTGMSSAGLKKKLKLKGFGGMKFGKTKGY
jgi:hypothetical protein